MLEPTASTQVVLALRAGAEVCDSIWPQPAQCDLKMCECMSRQMLGSEDGAQPAEVISIPLAELPCCSIWAQTYKSNFKSHFERSLRD